VTSTKAEAASEVLAVLDQFGWCQHPSADAHKAGSTEPVCAGLAIRRAMQLAYGEYRAWDRSASPYMKLWLTLEDLVPDSVAWWNDKPGRTEQEVRDMIRKAGEEG
jgi:hypothetical protein